MARTRGTRKPVEEKFITRTLKWPPELWSEVEEHVPERERSEFIRQAVKDALMRRAAERLRSYYATDPEVVEWAKT
jgi:metal-responsive CopG/Arc/MetJ family transcriptional regulator